MMRYFNKLFIKTSLCIFFITLVNQQVIGQSSTFTIDAIMDLKKAHNFKSKMEHGIKVSSAASTGWTVKIRVKSKISHSWSFGFLCNDGVTNEYIYLYGAQVTSNTNNQLSSNPFDNGNVYEYYKTGYFCWSERQSVSNDLTRLRENTYLLHQKTVEKILITTTDATHGEDREWVFNKLWKAPVEIIIELTGGVVLNDIKQIVIPGIEPFGFSVADLAATHACSNSNDKHCQVLKALKEPVKVNNDVFITAHRGIWGDQAESSLGAAKRAQEAGWNIIEMDVNRSKDGQLVLTHDQQLNRTAKRSDGTPLNIKDDPGNPNVPTDIVWVRDMYYNIPTINVPKSGGGTTFVPEISVLELYNKWGELVKDTNTKVGTDPKWTRVRKLEDLFDLMVSENWDVLIALDLKERVRSEYFQTIEDVLKMAMDKGVLDHILLKPGASVGADLPVMTVADYHNHLYNKTHRTTIYSPKKNLWDIFTNEIAIAPIIQPNWFTPESAGGKGFDFLSYVTPWIAMPSFAQFDAIYKNDKGDFLYNVSYLRDVSSNLNNKTPLQFLKDIGVRPGINWDDATDCRGAGNGRGFWGAPDDRVDAAGNLLIGDTRGNLEWLLETEPGMIVTDRPDVVKKYLELFGKNATLNKD